MTQHLPCAGTAPPHDWLAEIEQLASQPNVRRQAVVEYADRWLTSEQHATPASTALNCTFAKHATFIAESLEPRHLFASFGKGRCGFASGVITQWLGHPKNKSKLRELADWMGRGHWRISEEMVPVLLRLHIHCALRHPDIASRLLIQLRQVRQLISKETWKRHVNLGRHGAIFAGLSDMDLLKWEDLFQHPPTSSLQDAPGHRKLCTRLFIDGSVQTLPKFLQPWFPADLIGKPAHSTRPSGPSAWWLIPLGAAYVVLIAFLFDRFLTNETGEPIRKPPSTQVHLSREEKALRHELETRPQIQKYFNVASESRLGDCLALVMGHLPSLCQGSAEYQAFLRCMLLSPPRHSDTRRAVLAQAVQFLPADTLWEMAGEFGERSTSSEGQWGLLREILQLSGIGKPVSHLNAKGAPPRRG